MTNTTSTPNSTPLVIRLTDGTLLSSTTHAPSKRRNKAVSGRQGRKTYNGNKSLYKVGGYAGTPQGTVTAIGQDVLTPLCKVRTEVRPRSFIEAQQQGLIYSKRPFTWDVGGSCSTGYIGGRGA